jgi:hypothetical protein
VLEITAMDLQKINVGRIKPGKRSLDLIEDSSTRQATLVHVIASVIQFGMKEASYRWVITHKCPALGQNHKTMARNVELIAIGQG